MNHDKFWGKVKKTDECWLWNGFRNKAGYGQTKLKNATVKAHRYSWMLEYGKIPDGMFVCHKCDNPPCVRPSHLFLGTRTDNMRDAAKKGRLSCRKGEANYHSKMTEEKVLLARNMRLEGASVIELANFFGIKNKNMYAILNRTRWNHV